MALIDKETIRAEIERLKERAAAERVLHPQTILAAKNYLLIKDYDNLLSFLDTLPEQPVSDRHEIEVEFRGEKVTISREFYRDGEMNYSTSEQDDNAIWSTLRAWCEKKGITPFELYPKQSEQPMEGLEEEIKRYLHEEHDRDTTVRDVARHFAKWQKAQDQKTIELAEDHAMLAGMNKMEQQMMKKGYEAFISADNTIPVLPMKDVSDLGLDYGDKVRVIVIKEDEK